MRFRVHKLVIIELMYTNQAATQVAVFTESNKSDENSEIFLNSAKPCIIKFIYTGR